MTGVPRITAYPDNEGNPGFLLRVPMCDEFTARLQRTVMNGRLYWEGATASWWIPEEFEPDVRALVLGFFDQVVVDDGHGAQPSLLDPQNMRLERGIKVRDWHERLRRRIGERFAGDVITTDQVWILIEEDPTLKAPRGVSPNALGWLFQGWEQATQIDAPPVRSSRKGAKGNWLLQWRIAA